MRTDKNKHGMRTARATALLALVLLLGGCSMGQVVVRSSQAILDSGIEAMNREPDLQLARDAMPANIKLLEGMLLEDPDNIELRLFAAQGFYGYSYGFIEDEDRGRAAKLYRRCYNHGLHTLNQLGQLPDPEHSSAEQLVAATQTYGADAVPSLFWTASCLGKWIDLNRDKVSSIASLATAAALMQRVIELDDDYYFGGAHMFFGVYYGGRAPMLGGNFARSEKHFSRAMEINNNKLLLVDVLKSEYLHRQKLDQTAFHDSLTRVISADDNLYPAMTLVNAIAKTKAQILLKKESEWF